MSNVYEELSDALSHVKRLQRDLDAIREAAEQIPVDKKIQDKINYFKNQKESKEQKNISDLAILQAKKESVEQKFDAEIEALKQKKELAISKIESQITKVENCTTIVYYEKEIEKLLDSAASNRIKSQVEIRKEKELEDTKKKILSLEDSIRNLRLSEAYFKRVVQETQERQAANYARLEKERYELDKRTMANYGAPPSTLDDEDDCLPEPENEIIHT